MVYGIHLDCFTAPPRPLCQLVYRTGFRSVMLHLGGEYAGQETQAARAAGLYVENVHAPFEEINEIWKDTLAGEEVARRFHDCLEACHREEIPTAVFHLSSSPFPPLISPVGVRRFTQLVDFAETCGVNIALENQRVFRHMDYLFSTIESPRLKFCYDSGHEACFSHTRFILSKYRSRLAAVHLHDNDGRTDQHLRPGEGVVDWDYVRRGLRDYEGAVALELKPDPSLPPEVFYARALESARWVK